MLPVYCHMTNDLGACGGGGWTLVMKMNGTKVFTDLCTSKGEGGYPLHKGCEALKGLVLDFHGFGLKSENG